MAASSAAPVVVHPPASCGGRRVTARGFDAGVVHTAAELIEYLRRMGVDAGCVPLDDPGLIEWRGGGPAVWA